MAKPILPSDGSQGQTFLDRCLVQTRLKKKFRWMRSCAASPTTFSMDGANCGIIIQERPRKEKQNHWTREDESNVLFHVLLLVGSISSFAVANVRIVVLVVCARQENRSTKPLFANNLIFDVPETALSSCSQSSDNNTSRCSCGIAGVWCSCGLNQ